MELAHVEAVRRRDDRRGAGEADGERRWTATAKGHRAPPPGRGESRAARRARALVRLNVCAAR